MKPSLHAFFYGFLFLVFSSCASVKPYYAENNRGISYVNDTLPVSEIKYSLYLVGGTSLKETSPVLSAIEKDRKPVKSGLILLGDVLSVDDLPGDATKSGNTTSEVISEIKSLDNSFRDLFLIPGQKEWTSDKTVSHEAISSLDILLKDVLEKGRFIQPRKGCGTPEVIRIADNTIVVLIDSQWAIESESRSGEKFRGCELSNVLELKQVIKGIIQSHPADHIILASHHPIYANGITAGNYPLISHLIPLPVLGTIITGIKSLVGSNQHFGHPAYEAYRAAIISAVDGCKNCVVVSGHEKNMQYYHQDGQHYLVAGSGSDVGYARKGEKSEFSYMARGFIRADVLGNGTLHVSFFKVDENDAILPVFKLDISPNIQKNTETVGTPSSFTSESADSILTQASKRYGEKTFVTGNGYRKAWNEKIKLPMLWLDKVHGGLTPLQLGGGHQTRSLRLQNDAGEQYVLRSIDKSVSIVLPPALRGTFAESLIQDGIASSHPYGSLVVPRLAHAAGVYYARPSIVYVPRQSALGIYNDDIGNGVYLFEERVGGNTSGFANFGNTEKTYNTLDVIDMVNESHKNTIDQRSVLRARLFDIWLGDWDRHDDQVRWASFNENGTTVFRPIPRDRDQVFFNNDGFLNYLGSRPYFYPALRRFEDKIDYLPGLIWAGKWFDRSFLHELTEDDFIAAAQQLQTNLTDEVIDSAFLDWPRQIDSLDGNRIRSTLRVRRENLVNDARDYYRFLSRVVSIPGTDDPDIFTISAPDNHRVMVSIDRLSGSGMLYHFYKRIFSDDVTKEIQLFGLNKDDIFQLEGDGNPSILIRIIGGSGEDQLNNHSGHLHPITYDIPEGMSFAGKSVTEHLNNKPFNNAYDRTDWKLNKSFHFPFPAYFTDEGFGISYNFWWTNYGFRSDPFKSKHTLNLAYFFKNDAFIGKYVGEWRHAIGDFDLGLDAFFTGTAFTQFYYGLGNKYIDYGHDSEYHIVRGGQIHLAPSIGLRFGFGSRLFISPTYHYLDLNNMGEDSSFVNSPESKLTPEDFGHRHYAGLTIGYKYERLDNNNYPTRGGTIELTLGGRNSLSNTKVHNELLSIEGSLYIPLDVTGTFVFATHLEANKLYGEYEFFHSLTFGGSNKFRGLSRDRLAGDAFYYQASDLRWKLFQAHGIVSFNLGLYGSFDYGRVWYSGDDASANTWHTGFGGGIFIVPFGMTAFRVGYMKSEKDHQINVGGTLKF